MIIQSTSNPLEDLRVSQRSIVKDMSSLAEVIGQNYITMNERQDIIKRKYELVMAEDYVITEAQRRIHVAITNWKQYQEDLRCIEQKIKDLENGVKNVPVEEIKRTA